jgi:hypothetical protein
MNPQTEAECPPRMTSHPFWRATQLVEQFRALTDHLENHMAEASTPSEAGYLLLAALSGLQSAMFGVLLRLPGATPRTHQDLLEALGRANALATQTLQDLDEQRRIERRVEDVAGA